MVKVPFSPVQRVDECPKRGLSQRASRRRSLTVAGPGGRSSLDGFPPAVSVTLPAGRSRMTKLPSAPVWTDREEEAGVLPVAEESKLTETFVAQAALVRPLIVRMAWMT